MVLDCTKPLKITICGGGNAAHVLLALLGSNPTFEVRLWDLYLPEIPKFEKAFSATNNTVFCSHGDGKPDTHGRVAAVSADPAAVVPGADLLLIAVPAFAHDGYLRGAAPFVTSAMVVGCMVAEGGYDYALRDVFGDCYAELTTFAMETLPWACRIGEYARNAVIKGIKGAVCVSITPASAAADVLGFLHSAISLPWEKGPVPFPRFTANGGYLSGTLMNINAYFHPAIMYGQFRGREAEVFPEVPPFYEGCGDLAERTLLGFSAELMAIKAALLMAKPDLDLSTVMPIEEFFHKSYAGDIGDESSLGAALRTNKGYQGLKHTMQPAPAPKEVVSAAGAGGYVADWNARYMTEDIPFGLVSIKGIAEVAGVPTPTIDEVIAWSQERMGKEYISSTGSLTGKDIGECRCPQAHGWNSLADAL